MSSIRLIARKELIESIRNRSLWFISGFMYLFLSASLLMGWLTYKRVSEDAAKAKTEVRKQWIEQGEKSPHEAGHFGTMVFNPVNPLYIFEKGINNYVGQWIYLETHTRNDAEKRHAKDATSLIRFGDLTPAFFLQFLMPLFIILLCYSSFSSEKENNTIRLLLSQSIGKKELIVGKCLGNLYKLLLLYVPLFIVILIFIFAVSGVNRYEAEAMGTLFVFYFVFLLIFLLISTGVSLFCFSSKKSLLILFTFWMISCVFIPRLSSSVSEFFFPAPSSFDFKTSYEAEQGNKYLYGYSGYSSFNDTYHRIEHELMEKYHVATPDSLPVNVFGFAIEHTEEEGQQIFDKSYGSLYRIYEKQNRVHRFLTLISPLAAMKFLSMGLSNSDMDEFVHFSNYSEIYRRMMMKTLNMDLAYNSKRMKYNVERRDGASSFKRGSDLWNSVPDFNYSYLAFRNIITNHLSDILILLGWLFLSVLFIGVSSARLKT